MGGSGLVGNSFVNELNKRGAKVLSLTSQNFDLYSSKKISTNYFVNANGNSYRFKANKDPLWDFEKSVYSLAKSLKYFKSQKYIFFSSIDVYSDKSNPLNNHEDIIIDPTRLDHYGNNKFTAENILKQYHQNYLILRLGSVVSNISQKGPFYDLSQNKLYINKKSYLSVIDIENIHKAFFALQDKEISNEIFNLTCSGNVFVKDIIEKYQLNITKNSASNNADVYEYNVSNKKISKILKIQSSIDVAEKYFNLLKIR